MAKSIDAIQNELINDGTIDRIAKDLMSTSEAGFQDTGLIERAIIQFAVAFIERAKENINQSGSTDTGALSDGLTQGQVEKQGNAFTLEVGYRNSDPAAKYYDLVNKGVQGKDSGQPNSKYKFKTRTPSMDGPMVVAIQKWIKRQGFRLTRETARTTVTAQQRKRKAVSELNTGRTTAFLIARKIKRKGLKKTGFFDSAVEQYFGDMFYQTMAEVAGANVQAVIRSTNMLINKENK